MDNPRSLTPVFERLQRLTALMDDTLAARGSDVMDVALDGYNPIRLSGLDHRVERRAYSEPGSRWVFMSCRSGARWIVVSIECPPKGAVMSPDHAAPRVRHVAQEAAEFRLCFKCV